MRSLRPEAELFARLHSAAGHLQTSPPALDPALADLRVARLAARGVPIPHGEETRTDITTALHAVRQGHAHQALDVVVKRGRRLAHVVAFTEHAADAHRRSFGYRPSTITPLRRPISPAIPERKAA